MYAILNERLSLISPAALVGAREVSRWFTMPEGDNAVSITIVVITSTGAGVAILATLESSNDDENWSDSGSLFFSASVGATYAFSALLSGKRYRVNWLFGSPTNAGS